MIVKEVLPLGYDVHFKVIAVFNEKEGFVRLRQKSIGPYYQFYIFLNIYSSQFSCAISFNRASQMS